MTEIVTAAGGIFLALCKLGSLTEKRYKEYKDCFRHLDYELSNLKSTLKAIEDFQRNLPYLPRQAFEKTKKTLEETREELLSEVEKLYATKGVKAQSRAKDKTEAVKAPSTANDTTDVVQAPSTAKDKTEAVQAPSTANDTTKVGKEEPKMEGDRNLRSAGSIARFSKKVRAQRRIESHLKKISKGMESLREQREWALATVQLAAAAGREPYPEQQQSITPAAGGREPSPDQQQSITPAAGGREPFRSSNSQ